MWCCFIISLTIWKLTHSIFYSWGWCLTHCNYIKKLLSNKRFCPSLHVNCWNNLVDPILRKKPAFEQENLPRQSTYIFWKWWDSLDDTDKPLIRLSSSWEMTRFKMSLYFFLHILSEIGRSKNISQLFGTWIPLAILMYIEITYDLQMADVGSKRINKFRNFIEEISTFPAIFLRGV